MWFGIPGNIGRLNGDIIVFKQLNNMDSEKWEELCNEGLSHACLAYEKAEIDTCEEQLALCFKVLFKLFMVDNNTQTIKID